MNINPSQILKDYRAKYNLTQEGLAIMIGISRRSVERWEAGTHVPSRLAWKSINEVLKIKTCQTCGREIL